MRTLVPCWRAAFLLVAGARVFGAGEAPEPVARQIARLEQRVATRPSDFIAQTMLGELRVREVQENGDLRGYANAEDAFQKALAEFPQHSGALAGLASVRLALHRFAEAEDLARKILQHDGRNLGAQLLLFDAQLGTGKIKDAAESLQRLPPIPATFLRQAELAWLHGQNDEAVKLSLRAADDADARGDSAANRATYRVRAGEFLFRTGKFERAREQYASARKEWPESFAAAEHSAELEAADGKFDQAIAIYEKLIAQSERPDIEQALGDVRLFMRQPQLAKEWHERALAGYLASVQRGEVHFIHHLAGFYCDVRQDGAEAVKWARKDLEMRQTPATHDSLAWALYRAGDFAASRGEMDAALASGIKDAHILAHAAFIYSAAGDLARGEQFRREAAAANPRHDSFHVHR